MKDTAVKTKQLNQITVLGIDYAMQGMAVFSEKIEMEEAGFFLPVKNAVNVEG